MFEVNFGIFLVGLTGILLVSLPFVNRFYQKRADDYLDELLKTNPVEYNRQIKGNAFRYLIGGTIWGLLFLSGFILNFRAVIAYGLRWQTIVVFVLGVGCIAWGVWGYKKELRKIIELK